MSSAPKRAKNDTDTSADIRYVQVSDASSTGWPAVAKTVREADIDKIKDCKEDIDTLLVFAGLYSAVLSAFIIESYKTLQQDNEEVMVGLMQRLVAQNFVFGPGYLNSTSPFPEIPPFEPPTWAIRVNVLWFISLMFGLTVASFGMLVKQWLREYLALDYMGPRERLRARQYRTPALAKWKVFEIAAILPILLQISLGLFFVGLCFFTSAVHRSVRNATIPVVAAWAFLLVMTTIAPLFSPRCPFKTTFLKAALKAGCRHAAPTSRYVILSIRQHWRHIIHSVALRSACDAMTTAARRSLSSIVMLVHSATSLLRSAYEAVALSPDALWTTQPESGFQSRLDDIRKILAEEEDFIKTGQEDVEILTAVDVLISDDGILPTLLDTLKQQADPGHMIKFVLQAVSRRIGQNLPGCGLNFVPELSSLSKHTWIVTTDAIANTLARHNDGPLKRESPPWIFDAVIILLSHSPYALSETAVRALRNYIAPQNSRAPGLALGQRLTDGCAMKAPVGVSLGLLRLLDLEDKNLAILPLLNVYHPLLCHDPSHQHESIHQLFHQHVSDRPSSLLSMNIFDDFFDLAVRLGESWITFPELANFGMERKDLLYLIMRYSGRFGRHQDAARLCSKMLLEPKNAYPIISLFAALHAKARIDVQDLKHPFVDAYHESDEKVQARMIKNITNALMRFNDGDYGNATRYIQLDAVRLCQLLETYRTSENQEGHPWKLLWMRCAQAIRRYHEKKCWIGEINHEYWLADIPLSSPEELLKDDRILARECLDSMELPVDSSVPQDEAESQTFGELASALQLFVEEEVSMERTREG